MNRGRISHSTTLCIAGLIVALATTSAWSVPVESPATAVAPARAIDDAATPPTVDEASGTGQGVVSAKSLLRIIRDGGILMIPIGVCSFLLFVFVFERAISLRRGRIIPGPFVDRFLDQLQAGELSRESALKICEENNSPVARLFAAGVRKWGRPGVEVEQAIIDTGERICSDLRKHVRMMNGISTITPLLGLLGTVLGMIQAFDAIAAFDPSGGDSKPMVAAGISVALITTAAGLSVAIPALIAYLYFVGRVDQRIVELDALGMEVVHAISAEALAGSAAERRNPDRPRSGPNRNAA